MPELEPCISKILATLKPESQEHQVFTDLADKIRVRAKDVGEFAAIEEHHQKLLSDLNNVRKTLKLTPDTYTKKDNTQNISDINKKYDEQSKTLNSGQKSEPSTVKENDATESENTGIKKAITIEERAKRDLGAVALAKLGSDAESLQRGKQAVDSGKIDPREVVDRVIKTNGIYTPEEAEAMQYYTHQLKSQENDIRSEINAAPKDSFERDNAIGELQQHSDEMDALTQANRINSRAWSNLGNIMQIEADQSFSPANVRTIIKENYGGEIPKEVQDKIDSVLKERDGAISELKAAKEKMALDAIKKDSGFAERQTKRQQTKVELQKEREDIIDSIKKAIKKDLGNLNAGIPIPTETLTAIGKLAVNYFKDGVNTIEGLTDKIYQDLKEFNVDKRAIREAVSNYSALRETAQEKQLSKLETKEKSLNTQIESGEPKRPPTKSNIVFNKSADVIRAEQRIALAEKKLRDIKRTSFDSQKNWYQKGLMWLGRGFRLSILSGTNVLEKLASAATIGGALKRIPEQSAGLMWSNIFKGIAEKAPIEGGLNVNSEASWYKEFFNPKKFADNSWQILRHGESRLTQKMGGSGFEHVPILYLPTDLHQIIKDPVKRGTFEASFRNGLNHAERHGYDINDPLILNSIENAAYKRANYEIFQESNQLSRWFNKWKGKMESGTAEFGKEPIGKNLGATGKFLADFMIPVSTVPVNIARRVASTSPLGMIRGIGKVANAYRKGIENLQPEEADAVMRQLKQGTLGTALWLTGWFGAKSFGGLWTQFNPDKKRKEGALPSDVMRVDGENIPKPVQHALPLEVLQVAATARHIYDLSIKKKENPFEATLKAALGSIGAVAGELPVVETPVHLEEAATTPYGEGKLKEDVERRFEPAILKETGIIHNDKKAKKPSASY